MKSLRFLFLVLDCSNWQVTRDSAYDPQFDEEDQKLFQIKHSAPLFLRRGDVKETFINCAVDEALACSIWKTISHSKSGRRLERLQLWPTGGGEWGTGPGLPATCGDIIHTMARSWIFERVPRDDQDDFTVRELRQNGRMAYDQQNVVPLSYFHHPEIWEVFRSIWPFKEGSNEWRDAWSSFPLQV